MVLGELIAAAAGRTNLSLSKSGGCISPPIRICHDPRDSLRTFLINRSKHRRSTSPVVRNSSNEVNSDAIRQEVKQVLGDETAGYRPQSALELGHHHTQRSGEMEFLLSVCHLDVFSRYVTGWTILYRETAGFARQLIETPAKSSGSRPVSLQSTQIEDLR